jgi:hypothetical protein
VRAGGGAAPRLVRRWPVRPRSLAASAAARGRAGAAVGLVGGGHLRFLWQTRSRRSDRRWQVRLDVLEPGPAGPLVMSDHAGKWNESERGHLAALLPRKILSGRSPIFWCCWRPACRRNGSVQVHRVQTERIRQADPQSGLLEIRADQHRPAPPIPSGPEVYARSISSRCVGHTSR